MEVYHPKDIIKQIKIKSNRHEKKSRENIILGPINTLCHL